MASRLRCRTLRHDGHLGEVRARDVGDVTHQGRDGHLEARCDLRDESDKAQDPGAIAARVAPLDQDGPLVDVFAEQTPEQGRLAGTVGADQRNALAGRNFQIDGVEDAGRSEGLPQMPKRNHRGRPFPRA